MKVVELLDQRRANWSQLEDLCAKMEKSKRRLGAEGVMHFARLYRAACADLALADAYQLPPNTVAYLHHLVGRAHNQLYRSRKFNLRAWGHDMLYVLPQQLFRDKALRLAFLLFWGMFLASMGLARWKADYADQVMGKDMKMSMEQMYQSPVEGSFFSRDADSTGFMTGFYQWHNTTIGLRCFAMGLLFGVGGLFELVHNSLVLGAAFGHMSTLPQRDNFFEFVTAHAPFELTAIVLSAAVGMRIGFSLVATGGLTRLASLKQAAHEAKPAISAAVILFALAALVEAFVSPSAAPYWAKAMVSAVSSGLLMFYFILLGMQPPEPLLDTEADIESADGAV